MIPAPADSCCSIDHQLITREQLSLPPPPRLLLGIGQGRGGALWVDVKGIVKGVVFVLVWVVG